MTFSSGKTNNKLEVAYLGMFVHLETVGGYAWGAMALAFLYGQLKEATKANPSIIGGYLNLFQVCSIVLVHLK